MKDLVQETIEKIKNEKIKPTAKWKFIAKDYSVWFICFVSILLGAISLGLILFLLLDLDWDIYSDLTHPQFGLFLRTIPYFWIAILLLILALSFISFRKTKKGYRYDNIVIVLGSIGIIILLGLVAHSFHAGKSVHEMISKIFPQYSKMNNLKEKEWSAPEFGFLGGKIISLKDQGFDLKDFEGKLWIVDYDNKTLVRCELPFEVEEKVKLIGKEVEERKFEASEIRPWEGKGLELNKNQ